MLVINHIKKGFWTVDHNFLLILRKLNSLSMSHEQTPRSQLRGAGKPTGKHKALTSLFIFNPSCTS